MGLRDKLKKSFKSSSSTSTTSSSKNSPSLYKTDSSLSATTTKSGGRHPSNVYAPGETMPRPKYRAPVKKEHAEKLDAFSFGAAWRRKSYQSQYSPMGSRLPSRRQSLLSLGRKSNMLKTLFQTLAVFLLEIR
ncbi:hypothetical protein LTR28_005714, partial [Elasticomyces elasticus]